MIYDGEDLSKHFLMSANRPLLPAPVVETFTVPGKYGFEILKVQLESFSVPVECTFIPEEAHGLYGRILSADEIKRYVAAKLFRRELCPLIFDSDPNHYCMAIVSDVSDVERLSYVDKCTVTFLCEPFFYSADKTLVLSGTTKAYIGGTQPTRPVFEVTATSSTIKVTNIDTAEYVKVDLVVSAGAKVVIDMEARRATVNGNEAAVTIFSDFFALNPGLNNLKIEGGSAKMTYKEVEL